MRIDIVIPNYNGYSLLKKNLGKVIEVVSTYPEVNRIIIVDDGSDEEEYDNTKKLVDSFSNSKKPIVLFRQKNNKGFSTTVNRGVRESKAELVFLLNTDAVPEKGFIEPLIEDFEKDPKLFAVGCMDKSVEGEKIVLRGRGLGKWSKGFLTHSRGEIDKRDTLWVSGGSSVMRTEIFREIGGFDELFNPFYWEDIELSYRALKCGYNIVFEKRSTIMHHHEEGAIRSHYRAFFIKVIATRNQILFVWKDVTDFDLLINHLLYLPYYFVRSVLTLEFSFSFGLLLAVTRLRAIIQKRNIYKKRFVVPDKKILIR